MELQQHVQVLLLVFGQNITAELFFDQLFLGFCEFLLCPGLFMLLR